MKTVIYRVKIDKSKNSSCKADLRIGQAYDCDPFSTISIP